MNDDPLHGLRPPRAPAALRARVLDAAATARADHDAAPPSRYSQAAPRLVFALAAAVLLWLGLLALQPTPVTSRLGGPTVVSWFPSPTLGPAWTSAKRITDRSSALARDADL